VKRKPRQGCVREVGGGCNELRNEGGAKSKRLVLPDGVRIENLLNQQLGARTLFALPALCFPFVNAFPASSCRDKSQISNLKSLE
jgi:hypothetical protein